MKLIFGPAITDARQCAEKILQRESGARPMMSFQFGQGDQHACFDNCACQIKILQSSQSSEVRDLHGLIVIEINEFYSVMPQYVSQTALFNKKLDVAPVA